MHETEVSKQANHAVSAAASSIRPTALLSQHQANQLRHRESGLAVLDETASDHAPAGRPAVGSSRHQKGSWPGCGALCARCLSARASPRRPAGGPAGPAGGLALPAAGPAFPAGGPAAAAEPHQAPASRGCVSRYAVELISQDVNTITVTALALSPCSK